MKRIMYNSNMDFSELLANINGEHKARFFIIFFVLSFMAMSCLPVDVVLVNSEVGSRLIGSIIGSLIGGYGAKEVSKKIARNKLSSISNSLEEENIHILEEDLEKAVTSSIDIFEDRVSSHNNEIIKYFLVLDRERQIRILESIKTDLSAGKGKIWEKYLYVLDQEETKKVVIPKEEIDKVMGENYGKVRLQRKIK